MDFHLRMRREEEEEEVSFIGHEKSLGGILMGGREGSAHSSRRHLGRDADTEHHTTVVYNCSQNRSL